MNRNQIAQMEIDAGTAGDLLQAAICQIALNDEPNPATYEALSDSTRARLHRACEDGARGTWCSYTAQQILEHEEVI